jgi:nucleoside-diphosphate-sugar epimerase
MKILVTGANGFVGKELCERALALGIDVIGVCRKPIQHNFFKVKNGSNFELLTNIELSEEFDLGNKLSDVDVVIHTASIVHSELENENSIFYDSSIYKSVNVNGTFRLASKSLIAGVKRFIYISSVKVYGDFSNKDSVFTSETQSNPTDYYGLSKHHAENEIKKLCSNSKMDYVIIRPPLIYGKGAKGNFKKIIKLLNCNLPLPLGSINNLRSFISIDNLVDVILHCTVKNQASRQILLVSDGDDISTSEFIIRIAYAMNKKIFLFKVPISILSLVIKIVKNNNNYSRLFSYLQVDTTNTQKLLNWSPPFTMEQSLKKTFKDLND